MEDFIQHYGYWAVLVGTFLEGETVLILAGFAAHRGYLDLTLVMVVAFIGSVSGDQLFFYLGRRHSEMLLRHRPAWQPRINRAQDLIQRHRVPILLGFRFLYGLRTILPFTVGLTGMSPKIFVPLNLLGALAWSIIISAAGFLFGQALQGLFGHLKHVELLIMLGIAVIGGGVWVIHLWRARQEDAERH